MIDPEDTDDLAADAGRRLRLTREALGLEQQEFGAEAGLSQPRYNAYENGKRKITLEAATLLCARYSMTLDWIFRGDPSGLPGRMRDEIRRIRRQR